MASILLFRFLLGNILTAIFSSVAIFTTYNSYLKNPTQNPWNLSLNFQPSCLNATQYGDHKYIKANNITLHVLDTGNASKPLMLFMHGYPELWYTWRHQILYFKDKFRCVAMDMRGYAASDKPEGIEPYKLDHLIADVRDLITQLGYTKAVIVSHDWGGIVACRFRDTYPDMVSGLVMLSSTSHEAWFQQIWTTNEQRLKSGYIFRNQVPNVTELLLLTSNLTLFDDTMIVKGKNGTTAADVECFKYWFSKKNAFTPPLNYYRANFAYTWPTIVHTEKVPFCFIMPSNDPYISNSISTVMKAAYTTFQAINIDGVGHFMHQEDPDKVNPIIKECLANNSLI